MATHCSNPRRSPGNRRLPRGKGRNDIGGGDRTLQIGTQKRLDTAGVANRSVGRKELETERMSVSARGEKAITELKKAKERLRVHADYLFQSAGTLGCIFPSVRQSGRAIGS